MKLTQIYRNLIINGSLSTEELTIGAYTLPTTDGAAGEVLTTDGLGNVTFQSIGSLSLTTDDVTEGSNLYFTDERVDDRTSNLIQNGTGITWNYNDVANTLTPTISLTSFSTSDLSEGTNQYFTEEKVDDRVSNLIQNGTGISWNYDDPLGTLTPTVSLSPFSTSDLSEGTNEYFTEEKVDDRVSNLIQNGTGISWNYNDIANTLTPTVSLSSFTTDDLPEGSTNLYLNNENIDDRVASLIQNSSTVTWTYDDVANTLTADASSIVEVQDNGSTVASYDTLNFIEGSNITLNFTNDAINNRVDIEIVSSGGGSFGTLNTVSSSGVQVGDSDIVTLNFLDSFNVTESPNQQINIDLSAILSDLNDVSLVSPLLNENILVYNSVLGVWENSTIYEITPSYLNSTSSGICEGGNISKNTSGAVNTMDISEGTGIIVDNFTDPFNPTFTEVSWSAFSNITPTYLATATGSYILIQPNGSLLELPDSSPPTAVQKRDNILLGFIGHADNTNVISIFNFPMSRLSPANQIEELSSAIGPFNISGNEISLPGPGLTLDKASGTSYFFGGNFQVNSKISSTISTSSLIGPTLIYSKQDSVLGPTSTNVDTSQYDNAGTITAMPTNQFTNHRIWLDPINSQIIFQYGQQIYGNLADAEASIPTESYTSPDILSEVAYILGILITQDGTTDLSDPLDSKFIPSSKFGGGGGGTGGGGSSSTLQDVYDNSATPEILTDVGRGALTLRRGSAADSDAMYEVQNGAGSITFSLNGNGTITAGTWNGSTIDEIYGGTGKSSYVTGNLLYADSTTTLATIPIGSAGSFLRSDSSVPAWSTTTFPNSATTGDLIVASATSNYDNLTAVASGSVLLSQGVGAQPSYGLVVDGSTIDFTVGATLTAEVSLASLTEDYLAITSSPATGSVGEILTSDGSGGFQWSSPSGGGGISAPDVSSYSSTTVNLANIANVYDYYVGIDSTSNTVTINLPAASGGKVIYNIKDIGCASATNIIRIVVNGVDTIVTTTTGNSDYTIETNGAAIKLVSDGTSTWWLQ